MTVWCRGSLQDCGVIGRGFELGFAIYCQIGLLVIPVNFEDLQVLPVW